MRLSVQPRDRIFVKSLEFLSCAKNYALKYQWKYIWKLNQ